MKAMILAAGYGTRLKPLTDNLPKALVKVNNTPMLGLLIRKLIHFGVLKIIINVHHFADQIRAYLKQMNYFDIHIELSYEDEILGTGGGIKQASYFFDDNEPFLVHNVDILTTLDINEFYEFHKTNNHLVTVAMKQRSSSRFFLVGEDQQICGHFDKKKNLKRLVRSPKGKIRELAFSGIHIISPQIFPHMPETGFFSIVDVYLKLIESGYSIGAFRMDHYYWKDLGTEKAIREAENDSPSYF